MSFRPNTNFKLFTTVAISINLAVGLGSIFLVERILPAIEDILKENATSVGLAITMYESLAENDDKQFWLSLHETEKNISADDEPEAILKIRKNAQAYWSGQIEAKPALVQSISNLADINLKAMTAKDERARIVGISGAWALSFLVIVAICILLVLRHRIIKSLIEPVDEMLSVLHDYNLGNKLRRFKDVNASKEVRDGALILNEILDKNMHS